MPAVTALAPSRTIAWAEHGRGGGAVASLVGGAGSNLAHHLRAHVLELVGKLDLLGDGHAVLGDAGSTERLLDDDIAALRTEGHLDRIGQGVDGRAASCREHRYRT